MLLALEPVNLNHSSNNTTNQTPLLEINILAIKVAFIRVIILLIYITFHQVPGAELGEGGSVVDLSHIAPSVLALIQVGTIITITSDTHILGFIVTKHPHLHTHHPDQCSSFQGGDNALATAAKYIASSPPALQVQRSECTSHGSVSTYSSVPKYLQL